MKHSFLAAVAALASLAALSAQAAELKPVADEGFGNAPAVSDEALSTERARGEDGAALKCVFCTANGVSSISDNAFQNAVGVFSIVQNTGNQVFINTVTVVNVSISK
jgi:hypothetical protein